MIAINDSEIEDITRFIYLFILTNNNESVVKII